MSDTGLYVGKALTTGDRVDLDSDHLTTHAVCLGMTGSGKTGLGVVALEELARRGVPLLVVDLKGDMVNLLLNFPDLSAEAFAPWLPADEVRGRDRLAVATQQAEMWRRGLEGSGLSGDDVRAVGAGVRWQLLTPGVASAAPMDILPALSAPEGWDPDRDADAATERVNGLTTALLSLVDRGGDHPGALIWKFEHRHDYTEAPPSALGFELGYAGLMAPPFSDQGWRTTNLYWRQRFAKGRFAVVADPQGAVFNVIDVKNPDDSPS